MSIYKVFSMLCQVRKDAHHYSFIRSVQTSRLTPELLVVLDNWLRNDDK